MSHPRISGPTGPATARRAGRLAVAAFVLLSALTLWVSRAPGLLLPGDASRHRWSVAHRPPVGDRSAPAPGWSFPPGHATTRAMTAALVLAALALGGRGASASPSSWVSLVVRAYLRSAPTSVREEE